MIRQKVSGGTFLKIGSWYGRSSVILGQAMKRIAGHLYCVDWNLKCIMKPGLGAIRDWCLQDHITPLRGVTSEVVLQWDLDFLFIDGIFLHGNRSPDLNPGSHCGISNPWLDETGKTCSAIRPYSRL